MQLSCEAGVDFSLGGFRVEDCGVVAEVVEMAGCYQSVAACFVENGLGQSRILDVEFLCRRKDGPDENSIKESKRRKKGNVYYEPLLPGPQAMRILRPFVGGWTRYTEETDMRNRCRRYERGSMFEHYMLRKQLDRPVPSIGLSKSRLRSSALCQEQSRWLRSRSAIECFSSCEDEVADRTLPGASYCKSLFRCRGRSSMIVSGKEFWSIYG